MSMRLSGRRPSTGSDAASLRKWAMIFLATGVLGQGLIQNRLLNMGAVSGVELLSAMQSDPSVMALATIALMCKVTETCAVPLFSLLLVEGFLHTGSFRKYILRVCALALVSELPYNLALGKGLIDLGSRNPVFSLVICLAMLYFYNRYAEKGLKNTLFKAFITIAAFVWCVMLSIDHGIFQVIMVAFLWRVRDKSNFRAMFACAGAMVCAAFSLFYIGSGFACIMLHRYNEERGDQNPVFNYGFYPVLLVFVAIVSRFLA